MKAFVLDASVALSWFIDMAVAPFAIRVRRRLLDGEIAVVPSLWHLEVANEFVVAERRGVLSPSATEQALQNLDLLLSQSIKNSPESLPARRVISIAREYRLTAYDAAYLETAQREALPLATLDRALSQAASKAGVQLLR